MRLCFIISLILAISWLVTAQISFLVTQTDLDHIKLVTYWPNDDLLVPVEYYFTRVGGAVEDVNNFNLQRDLTKLWLCLTTLPTWWPLKTNHTVVY